MTDVLETCQEIVEHFTTVLGPEEDYPAAMVMRRGTETVVFPIDPRFMESDASKDVLFLKVLPEIVREFEADQVGVMVCAWTIPAEFLPRGGEDRIDAGDIPRPSEHPERIEVVHVSVFMRGEEKGVSAMGRMVRDEKKRPSVSEWTVHKDLEIEGRISAVTEALKEVSE